MPEPNDPGGLQEAAPTPLQGLTSSLGLLPSYEAAGDREVAFLRSSAARERADAATTASVMDQQSTERAQARPVPPTLPTPPDIMPRPFLSPGPSVLSQLQGALTGLTQMALGVGGLKGGGHAIAAVAGLKGALEGWAAGDHERANAALKEWKANSEKLQVEHENRVEAYRELLTDQKMDMANRLAMIGIRARIDGNEALAGAAERGQIKDLIDILGSWEQHGQNYALKRTELEKQIEQYRETTARHEKEFTAQQEQRRITNERAAEAQANLQKQRETANARMAAAGARAERGLKLREETNKSIVTLQGQETALEQKLANAQVVRDAVDLLDKEGILPRGATVWDTAKSKIALQSKPGRADIAQAVQIINRVGTPLVIGTEVGLGTTGGVMRLKVVGEAEAGNLIGAPKQFWDMFLPMAEKKWTQDRAIAREHLKRLDRLPPEAAEPEIIWKDDQ